MPQAAAELPELWSQQEAKRAEAQRAEVQQAAALAALRLLLAAEPQEAAALAAVPWAEVAQAVAAAAGSAQKPQWRSPEQNHPTSAPSKYRFYAL